MDIMLFAIFFVACAAAGATGAAFPPGEWYKTLDKPSWTPPDWAFPVAWSSIYLLISFAGARVAVLDGSGYALAFWAMQAAFSTLWTPVFFGLRRMKGALLVMVPLWLSVACATVANFQLDLWAGLAFAPYLIWVTAAAALNFTVWRMNKDVPPLDLSKI
ncbi:MAG: tryptophan-rich sensory protein [Litoreibacter sp.]|nr:tryptophan-rich sensory protein [Litoreibacter sp.]MCY4336159.1 tryptophan-rich sensory protein [Litoreibacter sp.]